MWIWVVSGLAIIAIVILLLGYHRVSNKRQTSPEEGIEDSETVQAYNRISKWPQFELLRKLIIRELKRHNPHGLLVDIGCGPGYLITDMRRNFKDLSIIGVDISDEMLREASKNVSAIGSKENTSFRQGDIHALPFEDNSVDYIISTLSLHHWSEPKQALNEIHRVLEPEGQFLLFDLRRDSPRLFYWLIRFAQIFILPTPMRRMNEPTSSLLANYTPSELTEIIGETSFKQYSIKKGIFWLFVLGRKNV